MPTAHDQRAREIFAEAAGAPPAQRAAILDERCGGDADLRREIESLLSFHDPGDGFLQGSALADAGLARTGGGEGADDPALPPGTVIGKYTIQRTLGAGGMGVVYEAEQESPRRRVALKVMRPGFLSASMARRFRQEAALLGLLQHPAIAQVFDAGKEPPGASGTPYLAMELVEGVPITAFARRHELSIRARLGLFLSVCEGVTHAHQRGVIHRDLKPANILVTPAGHVKVLDFGIARLAEPDPHATMVTVAGTLGGQLLGTLAYMSPEQAQGDPRRIDVRSDVYTLGVILFELMAGRLPVDVTQCALPEAVRRIVESAPPRLSSLTRACAGDIDTMAARALEKDRTRRYQSVADLAEDVRRHLAGEPIRAKGDSAVYVLGKAIRRHRWPVAAAGGLLIGLAGFGVYASVQADRERLARLDTERALLKAEREEAKARAAREAADAANARLQRELRISNVERGKALAESGSLYNAESVLWSQHLRDPTSLHSLFALRDLYRRFPIATAITTTEADGARLIASDPRGGRLFVSTGPGEFGGWDARTGEILFRARGAEVKLVDIAISAAGDRLASLGLDGDVRLWDVGDPRSPRELWRTPAASRGEARTVAISPDGTRVVACRAGAPATLIDARSGEVVRAIAGPEGQTRFRAAAFDPSGRYLALSVANDDLAIVDLQADPAAPLRIVGRHARTTCGPLFTPDGGSIISGSREGLLRTFDWRTGAPGLTLNLGHGTVRDVVFTPDGEHATVVAYWEVDTINWRTGERVVHQGQRVLTGGHRAAWLSDMSALAVTTALHGTEIWRFDRDDCERRFSPQRSTVGRMAASADGRFLLTVAADGAALWDTRTWDRLRRWTSPEATWAGAISARGDRVALISREGHGRLFDVASGQTLDQFESQGAPVDLAFAGDSRHLVIAGNRGNRILIRDFIAHTQVQGPAASTFELLGIAADADGRRIVASTRGRVAAVFDAASGEALSVINEPASGWRPGISPDGTRLAIGDWAGGVSVLDVATEAVVWRVPGHSQLVVVTAFSPDGRLVASASEDGNVKLWDAESGLALGTVNIPGADGDWNGRGVSVTTVAFIPRTTKLVVSYLDGVIEVWDLARRDAAIARNLDRVFAVVGPTLQPPCDPAPAREWAARVLAEPSVDSGIR